MDAEPDKAVDEPPVVTVEVVVRLFAGQMLVMGRFFDDDDEVLKLPPREELVNIRFAAELYKRKSDFELQFVIIVVDDDPAEVRSISLFGQNDGDGVNAVAKGRKRKEEEEAEVDERDANAESKGILLETITDFTGFIPL